MNRYAILRMERSGLDQAERPQIGEDTDMGHPLLLCVLDISEFVGTKRDAMRAHATPTSPRGDVREAFGTCPRQLPGGLFGDLFAALDGPFLMVRSESSLPRRLYLVDDRLSCARGSHTGYGVGEIAFFGVGSLAFPQVDRRRRCALLVTTAGRRTRVLGSRDRRSAFAESHRVSAGWSNPQARCAASSHSAADNCKGARFFTEQEQGYPIRPRFLISS